VQAPAGSGKTTLLAERFLRLLAEVDLPGQVVAITFTNAAAAEMRNRILDELRRDEPTLLARQALQRSEALGWKLLDLPAQLRISTIDSFCRELALQQPLLSGFGSGIAINEQPNELYRRAARETLRQIDQTGSPLSAAIEDLLLWRDNNWQEMEEELVKMLASRDRWMQGFVLQREPDWEALRKRLEQPFAHAVRDALVELSQLLDQLPGARNEALELARFACEEPGANSPWSLAESTEIPAAPFPDGIESAREICKSLSGFLQTQKGGWRSEKGLKTSDGFPSTPRGKAGKAHFASLIAQLAASSGLEASLAAVRNLPPARYTEDDWQIVRSCFTLLRHAAGELQVVFAEAGTVDFIEVAQIAQRVLRGEDGLPSDAALAVSDNIRHLLVDEFQDTSRRQHQLLASLIAAWPERSGRTCFLVGDPMQSIYSFRDADAELFPRVKVLGLEIPCTDSHIAEPLIFDSISLTSNFRTAPALVERLNQAFTQIFASDDGSGISFSSAKPAREISDNSAASFTLHLKFVPQASRGNSADFALEKADASAAQIEEIIDLIRSQMSRIEAARASGEKCRVAVLGRAKSHLAPIAAALRKAGIPFRALELEQLADRPEVLDALALARALCIPQDRIAWLGVLRAPWCGLALDDLHTLAGCDDPESHPRPIPDLLAERLSLLSEVGRPAAARVLNAIDAASALRSAQPTASFGTWLEAVWLRLGGAACVDAAARTNLNLLWNCLDQLPNGEEDLLGPGLGAALDKLTALPDPSSSSDCGVQLMTIHKSKGLEFEVVIVPELQARGASGSRKMLSWLERGLAEPDNSGVITEFLIAPFQRKGDDRGSAKAWVDRVHRERESQESRRILYVAATRAREQLHLFARPDCKMQEGSLTLIEPANNRGPQEAVVAFWGGSLLATAWPALQEEVRARFEEWAAKETGDQVQITSIAASSELLRMPSPIRPTPLRRLPNNFQPDACHSERSEAESKDLRFGFAEGVGNYEPQPAPTLYQRHEGGLHSRALGTAVHTLFETLARLREQLDWKAARSALGDYEPRIAAQVRAVGIDQPQATRIAAEALQMALSASHDPIGSWILSPHRNAASETAWTGVVAGNLRTVRIDRVFQAGAEPCSGEGDCWWIIDYKTAHADNLDPSQAPQALRQLYAPQIAIYAQLLRGLHGVEPRLFAGLYYPRFAMLDWWEL
jgi:ATP-dependent exoDNAse (exonuclease V) beta subunit